MARERRRLLGEGRGPQMDFLVIARVAFFLLSFFPCLSPPRPPQGETKRKKKHEVREGIDKSRNKPQKERETSWGCVPVDYRGDEIISERGAGSTVRRPRRAAVTACSFLWPLNWCGHGKGRQGVDKSKIQ